MLKLTLIFPLNANELATKCRKYGHCESSCCPVGEARCPFSYSKWCGHRTAEDWLRIARDENFMLQLDNHTDEEIERMLNL